MKARASFSYALVGLSPREEILFKSFVRLLDIRTHHKWFCLVGPTASEADLIAVVDEGPGSEAYSPMEPANQRIRLGVLETASYESVGRPIKPDELEGALNQLGRQLEAARANTVMDSFSFGQTQSAQASRLPGQPLPAPEAPAAPEAPQEAPQEVHRLLRWPPAQLVPDLGRKRMATVMTGESISLKTLAHRSGQHVKECALFVAELRHAGLLVSQVLEVREPGAPTAAAAPTAASSTPAQRAASAPPQRSKSAPTVQPGLLARIRLRLGLG